MMVTACFKRYKNIFANFKKDRMVQTTGDVVLKLVNNFTASGKVVFKDVLS